MAAHEAGHNRAGADRDEQQARWRLIEPLFDLPRPERRNDIRRHDSELVRLPPRVRALSRQRLRGLARHTLLATRCGAFAASDGFGAQSLEIDDQFLSRPVPLSRLLAEASIDDPIEALRAVRARR